MRFPALVAGLGGVGAARTLGAVVSRRALALPWLVALLVATSCSGEDGEVAVASSTTAVATSCAAIEDLVEPGFSHVLPGVEVEYSYSPPTSGSHPSSGAPAPGVHAEPIDPVPQVTALGGGSVLVQYDDAVDEDGVAAIEQLVVDHPEVVVAPVGDPIDGGSHVAATAWGKRLRCDGVEATALDAFIVAYEGKVHIHG